MTKPNKIYNLLDRFLNVAIKKLLKQYKVLTSDMIRHTIYVCLTSVDIKDVLTCSKIKDENSDGCFYIYNHKNLELEIDNCCLNTMIDYYCAIYERVAQSSQNKNPIRTPKVEIKATGKVG